MKIKDNKCSKCGYDNFFFADKGTQTGIYCSYCGKWLKWADKDEQNLRMKQESLIDKIRIEIEHVIPFGKEALSMKLGMLEIIDKYMAESEE